MKSEGFSTAFANGMVFYSGSTESVRDVDWIAHPVCNGVSMKHMIKGAETEGLFSSHLVRIEPGCSIDTHSHMEHVELHEVLEGEGEFFLLSEQGDYHPGVMAVIPMGNGHRVEAGKNGLVLLAKFMPALV